MSIDPEHCLGRVSIWTMFVTIPKLWQEGLVVECQMKGKQRKNDPHPLMAINRCAHWAQGIPKIVLEFCENSIY